MPYIKSGDGRREALQKGEPAQTAGELNYQIFYYFKHHNKLEYIVNAVINFIGDKPNYQRYNDMTGALIRCHKEIKRRLNYDEPFLICLMESYDIIIDEYEDKKILENGDVE